MSAAAMLCRFTAAITAFMLVEAVAWAAFAVEACACTPSTTVAMSGVRVTVPVPWTVIDGCAVASLALTAGTRLPPAGAG